MSSLAGTSQADYLYTSYGVNGPSVDNDAVIRTLRGIYKLNEIVDPSNLDALSVWLKGRCLRFKLFRESIIYFTK